MKTLPRPQGERWHAGRMLFALARYLDCFQQRIITEWQVEGLREDLVIVSKAGYATVIEIKISRADWIADKHKARKIGRRISRFFYAVPEPVYLQGIPPHVPPEAGILTVSNGGHWYGFDTVSEARAARRFKGEKVPEAEIRAIERAFYFRFWRQQMERERIRLIDKPAAARIAAGKGGAHA